MPQADSAAYRYGCREWSRRRSSRRVLGTAVPYHYVSSGIRHVPVGFRLADGGCGVVVYHRGAWLRSRGRTQVRRSASGLPLRSAGYGGCLRAARTPLRSTRSGMGAPGGSAGPVCRFHGGIDLCIAPADDPTRARGGRGMTATTVLRHPSPVREYTVARTNDSRLSPTIT